MQRELWKTSLPCEALIPYWKTGESALRKGKWFFFTAKSGQQHKPKSLTKALKYEHPSRIKFAKRWFAHTQEEKKPLATENYLITNALCYVTRNIWNEKM